MWQTVYPDTYTSGQTATGTSYTIAVGDYEDENSRMLPAPSHSFLDND